MMAHGFTTKVFECLVRQGACNGSSEDRLRGKPPLQDDRLDVDSDTGRQAVA
jgi:hypothetical protein